MSPADVERWIVKLRQRMDSVEGGTTSLTSRVGALETADGTILSRLSALEALIVSVPTDRLLGRYSAGVGPVEFVRIGTGLDLVGDTLTNTGGGGSSTTGEFSDEFSAEFA